uniref:(northern house mosquito) hypothetical protein n=1 Tax=Culex pipiens TaxID=7175 RepID=A0A8D8HFH9_CULPI
MLNRIAHVLFDLFDRRRRDHSKGRIPIESGQFEGAFDVIWNNANVLRDGSPKAFSCLVFRNNIRNALKWVIFRQGSLVIVRIFAIAQSFHGEPHVVLTGLVPLNLFPYDRIVVAAPIAEQLELRQLMATP